MTGFLLYENTSRVFKSSRSNEQTIIIFISVLTFIDGWLKLTIDIFYINYFNMVLNWEVFCHWIMNWLLGNGKFEYNETKLVTKVDFCDKKFKI